LAGLLTRSASAADQHPSSRFEFLVHRLRSSARLWPRGFPQQPIWNWPSRRTVARHEKR
jgi:hypothetical protein